MVNKTIIINKEEQLFSYWNSLLFTPRGIEKEFIEELLIKFKFEKTKRIIRELAENGFKKVKTMRDALDKNGIIKPKDNNKPTDGIRTEDQFQETKELLKGIKPLSDKDKKEWGKMLRPFNKAETIKELELTKEEKLNRKRIEDNFKRDLIKEVTK